MNISAEPSNNSILLKLFIPASEITESLYPLIGIIKDSENKQPFRKQKLYKLVPSKPNRLMLEKVVRELISNYSIYLQLETKSNKNINFVSSKLISAFQKDISGNEYIARNFDIISHIAKAFVFNEDTNKEKSSLKIKYNLDSIKDLLVPVIGTFGYGKTTLIKKVFNFSDDFIFPLVDNGRTTINTCYFRGMIPKGGFIIDKPINQYQFVNQITLRKPNDFYIETVVINMQKAFSRYCNIKVLEKFNEDLEIKDIKEVLTDFVFNDKAKLDELFGDIGTFHTNEFYMQLLNLFNELYKNITSNIEKPLDKEEQADIIELLQITFKESLSEKTVLVKEFEKKFEIIIRDKITSVIDSIRRETNNQIQYDEKTGYIKFYLTDDEIGNIDAYYELFVSNNLEHRGTLLRLIVDEIYTEMPLSSDILDESLVNHLTSIVFCDTMGASHKTNPSSADNETSNDIISNIALLNEADVILLLDKATQAMDKGTELQFKTLMRSGFKSKILLVYSFYDYFLKNDLANDQERMKTLISRVRDIILGYFGENKAVGEEYSRALTGTSDNLPNRISFLKGLIPFKEISDKSQPKQNKARENTRTKSIPQSASINQLIAERLNIGDDFGEVKCLSNLLKQLLQLNKNLQEKNSSQVSFNVEIDDTTKFSIFKAVNQFTVDYFQREKSEYLIYTPEYKTTEALCYRLSSGYDEFEGSNRTLTPYKDAFNIFTVSFQDFFEKDLRIEILEDSEGQKKDNGLNIDFLKDKIKSLFLSNISEFLKLLIITQNSDIWHKLYIDGGTGVKQRRSEKIYSVLEQSFSNQLQHVAGGINLNTAILNYLADAVKSVDEQYNAN